MDENKPNGVQSQEAPIEPTHTENQTVPSMPQPEPIDWLPLAIAREATPKRLRQETTRDFCKRMNIPESTYYGTVSRKENQEQILEITLNKAKQAAPDILEKLIEIANDGDVRAMDIYIDSILKLAKNLDMKSDGKPIFLPAELASKYGIKTGDAPAQ